MTRRAPIAFPPLQRPQPLAASIHDVLYAQLMSLEIPPGGCIAVDSLVRAFGVSQTPIREALSRLEEQGLVVKIHLVGYRAADQLDRRGLEQLYEVRLLLEPFAAARAAAARQPSVVAELREHDAAMRRVEEGHTRTAYADFDRSDAAFHAIGAACGNDLVRDTLHRLHTHVRLFRLFHHPITTAEANREHAVLIAATEAGNAAAAAAAMRHHVQRFRTRFERAF